MRKLPYRVWLPVVAGAVSVVLMLWDWHESYPRMLFDTGAPLWPYQTPDALLRLLNAPGLILAWPLLAAGAFWHAPMLYLIEFPFAVGWWWFVGTRIDFGLVGGRMYRHRWLVGSALILLIAVLVAFLGEEVSSEVRYWHYMKDHGWAPELTVRDVLDAGPILWSLATIFASTAAIVRMRFGGAIPRQRPQTARARRLVGLALVTYVVASSMVFWHVRRVDAREAADVEARSEIVRGRVIDERGVPVVGVRVDLLRVGAHFSKWSSPVYCWTGKDGNYTLRPDGTGEYFLAVHFDDAPDRKYPFLTTYYPAAEDQAGAEKLRITPALHVRLNPIRLNRLKLVRVPMDVVWSDGTREAKAYIFIRNTTFQEVGSIGDETAQRSEDGTVEVPSGFDYAASAKVDCDGGEKIESPLTPEVLFSAREGVDVAAAVRLVLPGTRCKLWHSK